MFCFGPATKPNHNRRKGFYIGCRIPGMWEVLEAVECRVDLLTIVQLKFKRRVCLDEDWVEIKEIVYWKRNYQPNRECGLAEILISHFGDTKVFFFLFFLFQSCFDPNLYFILFPINQIIMWSQLWRYKQQNQQVIKVLKQDNQSYKNKRY